jgi:hypothetical protein
MMQILTPRFPYKFHLLFLLLLCFGFQGSVWAQNESMPDTSNRKIRKLTNLKIYYSAQLKKSYVRESKKEKYTKRLQTINNDLGKILILKEETDLLELDMFLSDAEEKIIYAQEIKSNAFCLGASYVDENNMLSGFLSGERFLSERLSMGLYLGYYRERIFQYDSTSRYAHVDIYSDNYKYDHYQGGAIVNFHFFSASSPLFRLNPTKFDFYLKGVAGYSLVSSPSPFIETGDYRWESERAGVNLGGFLGLKYLMDDHVGFFVEGGYSNNGVLNAGIFIRQLPKEKAVKKKKY